MIQAKSSRFLALLILAALFSCSGRRLKEQSREELSHYVLRMSLVAPAIHAAMGPFDERGLQGAAIGLSETDRSALVLMSRQTFHPAKVYGQIHKNVVQEGERKELLTLARSLESELWQKFADNLLYFYGEEGSQKVAETMRLLDQEEMNLDMQRAFVVERLSIDSYNYKMVDILFAKTGQGSPGERFLYRKSLFVTTYLATQGFSQKDLEKLQKVRSNRLYQAYKDRFEKVVSGQYDSFFLQLKSYYQKNSSG